MLDSVEDIIVNSINQDFFTLLKSYENTYSPEIGLVRDEQIFDLKTELGDIKLYGFYPGANLDSIVARAMQDVLIRLFVNEGNSEFIENSYGVGLFGENIGDLNDEIIEGIMRVALTSSPFIGNIGDINSQYGINRNEVDIKFSADTITGNPLTFEDVIA